MTGPAGARLTPGDVRRPVWGLAVMVPCGFCWAEPNTACAAGGQHFERYLRAWRRGLIGREVMREVCAALGPVSAGKLVPDTPTQPGSSPAQQA
jgi:hypothetical protein